MTTARTYDDPCGVARALDVVGDRWSLLVVRELLFGAKRFAHLRTGLHGISPNVLSQRLRELADAGVIQRCVLERPASVTIYELTERGRALAPLLRELGRWGSAESISTSNELSVSALMLALQTAFDPGVARDATFAVRVDGEWFRIVVANRSIDISRTRTEHPAVTLETDVPTLRSVAFGRESITSAERDGRLALTGDRRLAGHFSRMFPVGADRTSRSLS
jgi:DNA-binding HxlR family transcriptional regulator